MLVRNFRKAIIISMITALLDCADEFIVVVKDQTMKNSFTEKFKKSYAYNNFYKKLSIVTDDLSLLPMDQVQF